MRIVVATFGSLGDLHPYIAIALGLQARGHVPIVAAAECYRTKIEGLGLEFRPVRPDCALISDPVVMRRLMHPNWGMMRIIREVLMPSLPEAYEDTLAAVEGTDLLVASSAVYAARLVAEKIGLPWVSAMHIPMGFFSAHDPPLLPGAPVFSKCLLPFGPALWKPLGGFLKWATRSWAKPWHRLRQQIGLPPINNENPLVDGHSPLLHLALFSKLLADKQCDWPAQTLVTGFPWFQGDAPIGLPADLARFLDAGPPPIVFTLGTAVAADPGSFYEVSAAAARQLGRRAVLVLKEPRNCLRSLPDDIAAVDYAPFSELFPRAAAIVHHGGIGTTGLGMRSGRPMLIVPCAWDQPDNAARAARLGIARVLPIRQYTPARATAELRLLLEEPRYAMRALEVGKQICQEDGVEVACDALEALVKTTPSAEAGAILAF